MVIRALGAVFCIAAADGALAQAVALPTAIGDVAPELEGVGWHHTPPDSESQGVRLIVFAPRHRTLVAGTLRRARACLGPHREVLVLSAAQVSDEILDTQLRHGLRFGHVLDGRLRARLVGHEPPRQAAFALLDSDGRLLRRGRFDDAVVAELDGWCSGVFRMEHAARLEALRQGEVSAPGPRARGHLFELLVTLEGDDDSPVAVVERLQRLVDEARSPAVRLRLLELAFDHAEHVVRIARFDAMLRRDLRAVPRDDASQELAFRWCMERGDADGARRHAQAWLALARASGSCDRVVTALERTANSETLFPDLFSEALEAAIEEQPGATSRVQRWFELEAGRRRDAGRAFLAGRRLVTAMEGDARALNSFAWRVLTKEPFVGRFDLLGLEAARAMERADVERKYWRLDTLALACFRNGLLGEAVALQREALQGCGSASRSRYADRLADYEAAAAAASPGR